MKASENYNKMLDEGKKLYDNFCLLLNIKDVATPATGTLLIFRALNKISDKKRLLREMMKEFLSNYEDSDLISDGKTLTQYSRTHSNYYKSDQ